MLFTQKQTKLMTAMKQKDSIIYNKQNMETQGNNSLIRYPKGSINDDFKAGFATGQTDRSAEIAKTLLSQGWSVEFVARTVMLEEEVVTLLHKQIEK